MSDAPKMFRVRDDWEKDEVRLDLPGGHVAIVGRTPRELPQILHREAYANGCETVNDEAAPAAASTTDTATDQGGGAGTEGGGEEPLPPTPEEQPAIIKEKILKLLSGDNSEDFTAAGSPNLNILTKMCGFQVKKAAMDPIWEEIKQAEDL